MDSKRLIRLTESDLHRIVKESVNKVLNEIGDTPGGQYDLGRYAQRNMKIYGDDRGVHDYSKRQVDANDSPLGKARMKDAYVRGSKTQGEFMDAIDKNDETSKRVGRHKIRGEREQFRNLSDRNLKKKYRV